MSMGKTIRSNAKSIVLAAVVAGAAVGCCKEYKEYTYDGKIGQEQVKFVANYNFFRDFESHKSLEVTRTNGTKVTYLADGHKDTFDINTIIINKLAHVMGSILLQCWLAQINTITTLTAEFLSFKCANAILRYLLGERIVRHKNIKIYRNRQNTQHYRR